MLDAELTRDGHRMAEAFAARWARHASGPIWRAIYISTRRRVMETAAPFAAALGKVPIVDRGLDEINYGSWQGRTKDEIQRADPEGFRRWLADPMRGAPDGESPVEVARRARDVVEGIRCLHATEDRSGDVLVVGHKTWLRLLICQLTGIELRLYRDRIPQPVAAHTVVEFDGRRWWLRRLADRLVPAAGSARAADAAQRLRGFRPHRRATAAWRPRRRTASRAGVRRTRASSTSSQPARTHAATAASRPSSESRP